MSQPPPPPPSQPPPPGDGSGEPQVPPGGGYGYPQQQPDGGFGVAQQPTQAAGFPGPPPPGPPGPPGHPQPGPYGQPQQPGPYGHPQPGPYGQQPQSGPYGQPYGKQPQYGHPGMPTGAMPGGRPPGGNGDAKVFAIIAAVVAVLLIVGGGVWLLAGDDGGGRDDDPQAGTQGSQGGTDEGGGSPANVDGEMLFTMDAPKVGDSTSVAGAWSTEKYFAKSSLGKIVGVGAADGAAAWEIPLDGQVCAASPHQTEDDKTAVITRETDSEDADCNQLVVIDLRKGKEVWQQTIPGDADVNSLGGGMTMSQGTIAAAWIGGTVGYRITGGDPIWVGERGDCRVEGYAGGEKLVAAVRCGDYDNADYRVQTIDPKTGKAVGEFQVPGGVQSVAVASTDPLVLGVGAGEYGTTDIMTVTEDHKLDAKISLGERYHDPCRTETESCWTMAASDDLVFLATKDHDAGGDEGGRTNALMAFDAHTGATEWKVAAGAQRTIMPIGMDGESVLAYRTDSYQEGGQIVSIDPETEKETLHLALPSGDELDYEKELAPHAYGAYSEVIFEHGRLFFHQHLISERAGAFTEERILAVGYGPA